jgi:hypothetical protein
MEGPPVSSSPRPRYRAAFFAALTVVSLAVVGGRAAEAVPSPAGSAGTIQTMGGVTVNFQQGGYGPEGPATQSQFLGPRGLAFAPNGDVYIADTLNHRIRRIDANGVVDLVAGNGTAGNYNPADTPDGVDAKSVSLNEPHGVAADRFGNVFIADSRNCIVRKLEISNGTVSRFAGTGARQDGPNGEPRGGACIKTAGTPDGKVLEVAFDQPRSLFMTSSGGTDTLWIADTGNSQIRRIDVVVNGAPVAAASAMNVRVAGTAQGYGGDGGDALTARFRHPEGLWVSNDGTIYVTDRGNNLVRRIARPAADRNTRRVTVVAGDVAAAAANANKAGDLDGNSDGDGGGAINAHVDQPSGITGDNQGNLYVAEAHGSRIRRIKLGTGGISTIAGDGTILEQRTNGGSLAIKGDPQGPALEAQFAMARDIRINPADGSLWIADSRNNRIRAVVGAAAAPAANIATGGGTATAPAPTHPMAPESVGATAGDGSATVTWETPVYDGGSPITSFIVTSSGGQTASVDGSALSATLTGLTNGTPYTFTVQAKNSLGKSAASAPSAAVTPSTPPPPPPPPPPPAPEALPSSSTGTPPAGRSGYWMVGTDGTVYPFGDAKPYGNAATTSAVDLEPTPSGNGYWIVDDLGRVFAFGDAVARGNVDRSKLAAGEKVTSLSATGDGGGYWIFTNRGRVVTFGNAVHLGDVSRLTLAGPVLDSIVTPSGQGYYMVASDGGIFAFGDAVFYGSMGSRKLNAPVQSLVPDSDGAGYWLVASDGGIFAFEAGFKGSMGGTRLNRPVTGMVSAGTGYLMVSEDGGIFDFSGSPDGFKGSLGANPPAKPITSVAVLQVV